MLDASSAMPNGNHGATIHRARYGEPQPVPGPLPPSDNDTAQREPTKKDLTSWWRSFKRGNNRRDEENREQPPYSPDRRASAADGVLSHDQMKPRNIRFRLLFRSARNLAMSTVKLITRTEADSGIDSTEQEKGIFGVPLQTSIRYANVAISLYDAEGKSYIYGYVPIVVAKCGVFLKEKGTKIYDVVCMIFTNNDLKQPMLRVFSDSAARRNA